MPNIWASLNVPFIHFLLQFFPNSNITASIKDARKIDRYGGITGL
jgi:hypothetical protein